MGGQNYGTFWIKKGCAPFCALFGQIMCDFELKTIGNSDSQIRRRRQQWSTIVGKNYEAILKMSEKNK